MTTSTQATAQLADDLFQTVLDASPVDATLLGIRDRDDQLTDYREAGDEAIRVRLADIAARADTIDPAPLSPADRLTRAVVEEQASAMLGQSAAREVEYTVTDSFIAPVTGLLFSLSMVAMTEPVHAESYLTRLARVPGALAAIAERHRAGIAAGRLPVRHLAEAMVRHLDRYLTSPEEDPLRRPQPPVSSPAHADAFQARRDRLLTEQVYPAVARYREVLAAEVVPHGRSQDRGGLCWLPDGDAHYARLARAYTTSDRSPAAFHQIGLELVARLAEEYAEVGSRALGTSDVPEILTRLRDDPALRWRDGEELLSTARATISRAERAAPAWFGRLPAQPCQVEPVPAAEAPGAPAAYYVRPALDGSRPGIYFANTHQAAGRSRAAYEAIAFHEAIPGHHLQFALAQELTELPPLYQVARFTAYTEGWGLYAERLADEMGLYSTEVFRLGMLSEDSMRAARLVVDTGLHALGWSRRQVVDYLRANTASSLPDVEVETDRYLAAPGQALAYMVGRLEFQRMRAEAERELADRFDLRDFHDTVLGNGPLPLTVLDGVVRDWVRDRP
jgi:uncharacterized protein (DUF885 family)